MRRCKRVQREYEQNAIERKKREGEKIAMIVRRRRGKLALIWTLMFDHEQLLSKQTDIRHSTTRKVWEELPSASHPLDIYALPSRASPRSCIRVPCTYLNH